VGRKKSQFSDPALSLAPGKTPFADGKLGKLGNAWHPLAIPACATWILNEIAICIRF
jgi:hypothetical protein